MKKINILNRCVCGTYRFMDIVLKLAGLSTFKYSVEEKIFVRNSFLHSYVKAIFGLSLFGIIMLCTVHVSELAQGWTTILKLLICTVARLHQITYQQRLTELLNEYLSILRDIRTFARHPNIFRFKHLLLIIFALQGMLRSWSTMNFFDLRRLVINYGDFLLIYIFIVAITMILLIFIALVACYDELHRCTRRISNDVRTLCLSQTMCTGQRMVLLDQLCGALEELIELRARMFSATVCLMKLFRFHLLMAVLYWLGHIYVECINDTYTKDTRTIYRVFVSLMNLAYYFTIFELFIWKSKLSRSFWCFYMVNYSKRFDEDIDILVHRELFENIKVTAYGLRLDMKLFIHILRLTFLYVLVLFVFKKI